MGICSGTWSRLRRRAAGWSLALAVIASPAFAAPCAGFTDVDDSSGFCANVGWLKNRSITLGCTSATLYCPSDAVVRLGMAAFMNRLGTALTPVQLRVDAAPGAIDLDANPVVCQTQDFLAEDFARIAYADLAFSGQASADVGLAAALVMSLDAGATWSNLNLYPSRGSVRANQWGTLTDLGFAALEAEQTVRFGARMSRFGPSGGADLAVSRCQLRVSIYSQDETAPPVVKVFATVPNASEVGPTHGQFIVSRSVAKPTPLTVQFTTGGSATACVDYACIAGITIPANQTSVQVPVTVLQDIFVEGTESVFLNITPDASYVIGTPSAVVSIADGPVTLPPNPATVAPPADATVATSVFSSTEFLYGGPTPIQFGVAPGTIEARRVAVLRGKVQARDGSALSGVAITIAAHPELGYTLSRADGAFDLAVNGGGVLTVNYRKAGFLAAQRQIGVPWQDFAILPDVVMIPLDAQVTPIAMGAGAMQVARGSPVNDAAGSRRATLLVPQGTTANLLLPDGTTQPIASLAVRATEYTVGPNGPNAMPAMLPPTSGYTYAVELSADEAIAAGATSVVFNQPVANYVENFLGFPVGGAVPAGFYDRAKAAWVPSLDGRVIKITAINAGVATVDSVGSGSLPALVLSTAERQQLAALYSVGQELWRVPVTHFTPWDYNWPMGPPADAIAPQVSGPTGDNQVDDGVCTAGSIVECENQTLGESVGLVGTSYSLNYRSSRVPGRNAARTLRIPLSGGSLPASLKRISLRVTVAGRAFDQTFAPATGQQTTFTWDGTDLYGRTVQGSQSANVTIGYVYDLEYKTPAQFAASFAAFGGVALGVVRNELTIPASFRVPIGPLDARGYGIAGWTLDRHHFYDASGRTLHLGDGRQRSAESLVRVIDTVAGGGTPGFTGEGGPATQASLNNPLGVAVASDGTLYIAETNGNRIRRVTTDGIITTIAGTGGAGFTGDGGPAAQARINNPFSIAVAPDGSVHLADTGNSRIRRIGLDGIITTVAGNGAQGSSGDGGPATQAGIGFPSDLAFGPDGSLYISARNVIRRVGPDGIISTVAGNGGFGFGGDGGPATQAPLGDPRRIALGPDGSLYLSEITNRRIRRVSPDGIIRTVAGNGTTGSTGDGGPAIQATLFQPLAIAVDPHGSLYVVDGRVRRVTPDGIIATVAGKGLGNESIGDKGPATAAELRFPQGIALGPDGSFYVTDHPTNLNRIRRVTSSLAGFSALAEVVASEDGGELYEFDAFGRHVRTVDALTGASLLEFGYDAAGRVTQLIEKTGGTDNVTIVQRDAAGNPTAIVAPFGQQTTLAVDGNGFLASIANPASEQIQLASTAGGLLTGFTDPRGKATTYLYDGGGRLTRSTDAVTGFQTLARTELPTGFTVDRSTALARTTHHKIDNLAGNIRKRTITAPDGTQALNEENFDAGLRTLTGADGAVTTFERGPDPRFGMQAPIAKSLSVVLPGGPTLTAASTRTAVLSNPVDLLSLTSLTGTSTVDGRTTTSTYTAATRTEAVTTAGGRTGTLSLDALGRPIQLQAGGLASAAITYDSRGRLATIVWGSGGEARTYSYAYHPQGYLASITDPIGRTVQFTQDAAGRVIGKTLPDGTVVAFGYDAAGNLTSVTPPGRPAHAFAYSDRDEMTMATPPAVAGTGPTSFGYNLDRQVTTTLRPDNRSMTLGYDAGGRFATRTFALSGATTGTDTLSYDAAGRVASVAAASGITTSYDYAGSLLTGETWAGPTAGSVSASYDASFRLATQSVNGANPIAFAYDNDSLVIGAGALAITRNAQHGLPTGSTLGVVLTTTGYNAFGEATSHAATANGAALYSANVVRDKFGRITQKTETVGGVTDIYVYSYDAAGQLIAVVKNGATVESYGYDTNGNRVSATVSGSTIAASYDAQDRVTSYGSTTFAYNAAGDLLSRTAGGQVTGYQYDAAGNLLGVTLPGATTISYVVDGRDRRVGRRVNGTLVQGFLYGDALRPVAELDGTGALTSRFVYAESHVPAYLIRGGVAHRLVVDQVGSVRLVVDSVSGAIVQRIDYDTFGNVTQDTNPGFQPFGFAGGIYDAATGLVRFGARDYDPKGGRWTTKDPLGFGGGDTALYRYARNDPVNLTDPGGRDIFDTLGGVLDEGWATLQLMNPIVLLGYTLETILNPLAGLIGQPPARNYHDIVHPPEFQRLDIDRMSADYTKGELIVQCVGIVTAAAGGVGRGIGAGIAALERKMADAAARAARQAEAELARTAAKRARQQALDQALEGVGHAKGQGGGRSGGSPKLTGRQTDKRWK